MLVDDSIKEEFLAKLTQRISTLYGEDASQNPDFGAWSVPRHTERVSQLIEADKVLVGGEFDIEQRYIAPTVMHEVDFIR